MAAATRTLSPRALFLLVVVVAATFLYSVFVATAPLAWVGLVAPIVFLYLMWRLVRGVERIAVTLESAEGDPQPDVDTER